MVNPGDNITMQCSLTGGDPQPEVVWSHSPGPMPPNSLVQGGNLTIWRIRVEDSGYYNCTAINNVGNPAKKIVNLLVRCKLLFFSEHVFSGSRGIAFLLAVLVQLRANVIFSSN